MKKILFYNFIIILFISIFTVFSAILHTDSDTPLNYTLVKSFGDIAFTILCFVLIIGPLVVLNPKFFAPIMPLRRYFGIWFTVVVILHFLGMVVYRSNYDLYALFGYSYSPTQNAYVLYDAGVLMANLLGVFALLWAIALAFTSFDKAMSFLGPTTWKRLHMMVFVIFHLAFFHVFYYLVIEANNIIPAPENSTAHRSFFTIPMLILSTITILLQFFGYVKTILRMRSAKSNKVPSTAGV